MSGAAQEFHVSSDVALQSLNTLAIPAKARAFAELSSAEHIAPALAYAKSHALNVLVLGEGSNCVFASDFSGLVLRNCLKGIELLGECDNSVTIKVAAGENWHNFVSWALDHSYYGLENLALIPGTVGAAPIQNIGAYGVEVEQFIERVLAVDVVSGESLEFAKAECGFAYRESIFKRQLRDRLIITDVVFNLSKVFKAVDHYPSLA